MKGLRRNWAGEVTPAPQQALPSNFFPPPHLSWLLQPVNTSSEQPSLTALAFQPRMLFPTRQSCLRLWLAFLWSSFIQFTNIS